MDQRPVLYLDLDDTILVWENGNPRGAPGVREFLEWALDRYEVRWLTRWCPSGEMKDHLLGSLCKMVGLPAETLQHIRGCDWAVSESKLDGIAWLEHLVLGRPFLWIEDEYGAGEREREVLAEHGLLDSYRHINVSKDPAALGRVHRELREREQGTGNR